MPPRRSESPEGVGDLLKQDSLGFEEEEDEAMHDFAEVTTAQEAQESASRGEPPAAAEAKTSNGSGSGGGRQQGAKANSFKNKAPARYFIVKSNNHSNIDHSIKNGIWATQKHNEDKLVEAYRTASHVYLIFSVNMSGHFQGYARMTGLPFRHQPGAWEGSAAVSNSFNVDWIRRYDLPFKETEQLINPLNENKPIKISRDGQELPLKLGLQLSRLFDTGADAAGVPKPPRPVRDGSMRAGPAVSGNRGPGRGPPPMGPRGMVMTPMGMMPTGLGMGMGMGPMMGGMGFGGPGMMEEMMGPMGMGPMGMGMHPMMGPMMGMGGMPGRGPVPPPRPPPPRSPPPGARPPPESEYHSMMNGGGRNRMHSDGSRSREEDLMIRALEIAQRGRSPRRERRYRSRSRSASPRRGRSRRHSRSRSRSRSRGRGRDREELLEMSYDEYLDAFKALKKAKMEKDMPKEPRGPPRDTGMNPMMGQMMSMMGGSSAGTSGGGMPSMTSGGRPPAQSTGGSMSEDDYVRVWENYSRVTGRPFDAQTVRGWYRQYKQVSSS